MKLSQSKQLENWLSVLISCYQIQPSSSIVKHIVYYLDRIIASDDCHGSTLCQYHSMKRFWHWQLLKMQKS